MQASRQQDGAQCTRGATLIPKIRQPARLRYERIGTIRPAEAQRIVIRSTGELIAVTVRQRLGWTAVPLIGQSAEFTLHAEAMNWLDRLTS